MLRRVTGTHITSADSVRDAFRVQAEACMRLGSPFSARLCRLLADRLAPTVAVSSRILSWTGNAGPSGDSVPLRLCGALHERVLAGGDPLCAVYPPNDSPDDLLWAALIDAFRRHEAAILARLASPPQTNEVRRSAVLLPGFLSIGRRFSGLPFVMSEVGASAGLNMNWDRYAYRLGAIAWGDRDSPVQLGPEWRGASPPEPRPLIVAERAACDLDPPPVDTETGRRRLLAYIWPDQPDRLALTRAALQVLARRPLTVERADAIDWLRRRLESRRPGAVHLVYHTIMWQYLRRESQAAGEALLCEAGRRATADAPLAWLRFEGDGTGRPGAALRLTTWPGGADRLLARADFHGRWIEWLAGPEDPFEDEAGRRSA